jgi:hypothetical protein
MTASWRALEGHEEAMDTGPVAGHQDGSPARSAPDLRDPGGSVVRTQKGAVVPGSHGLHAYPNY